MFYSDYSENIAISFESAYTILKKEAVRSKWFLSKQHKETYNILCMIRKNNVEVPVRRVKYPPLAPAK